MADGDENATPDGADYAKMAFPDETPGQFIERLVNGNPAKHGTPEPVRKRIAVSTAYPAAEAAEKEIAAQDQRIRDVGGDPDEMMPGNRPRYTVDEDGNVKDHDTGAVHYLNPKAPEAPDAA